MNLNTNRLVIRPFEDGDVKSLVRLLNNFQVSSRLRVVPYPYTEENAEWWVSNSAAEWKKNPRCSYSFAIVYRDSNCLIGGCGLIDVNDISAGMGYWLGEEYHGKGLGTEMLHALIDFSNQQLKLSCLWADAYDDNVASIGLLKKCGFKRDSTIAPTMKLCMADGIEKVTLRYVLHLNLI